MEQTDNLIQTLEKMRDSFVPFNCEKHGQNDKNTPISCVTCKNEAEELERINTEKTAFAEKQNKANIQEDILGRNYNFDNYYPTCENSFNFKRRIATYAYNKNLLLCGKCGTGKSHMGYALINQALKNDMTAFHVLFYNLNHIYIKKEDKYQYLLRCDFLVIDEFGIQETDYTSGLLYMILDERNRRGKYTMLITNLSVDEFKSKLPPQLYSRYKEKDRILVCVTDWEDYRLNLTSK